MTGTNLVIHPAYPTRAALLDGIAAARESLSDHDAALALIADGLTCGVIPEPEAARMFVEAMREVVER